MAKCNDEKVVGVIIEKCIIECIWLMQQNLSILKHLTEAFDKKIFY